MEKSYCPKNGKCEWNNNREKQTGQDFCPRLVCPYLSKPPDQSGGQTTVEKSYCPKNGKCEWNNNREKQTGQDFCPRLVCPYLSKPPDQSGGKEIGQKGNR